MQAYLLAYLVPFLATLGKAQDDRTLVTGFTQQVGVSNGGVGGTGLCKIEGKLDRGNEPVSFAVQETCDAFQDSGLWGPETIEFDENPDLTMEVSCDVKAHHCATFMDIKVETTDGYCNQGRTYRIDCPETDFRKRNGGSVIDARQEPTIQGTKQCYADILLVECFE